MFNLRFLSTLKAKFKTKSTRHIEKSTQCITFDFGFNTKTDSLIQLFNNLREQHLITIRRGYVGHDPRNRIVCVHGPAPSRSRTQNRGQKFRVESQTEIFFISKDELKKIFLWRSNSVLAIKVTTMSWLLRTPFSVIFLAPNGYGNLYDYNEQYQY